MENMVTIYPADYCMDCNTEHSMMVCDIFNNEIPISRIIDNNSLIDNRELSYIKCKKCSNEYNIDFSDNYFDICSSQEKEIKLEIISDTINLSRLFNSIKIYCYKK